MIAIGRRPAAHAAVLAVVSACLGGALVLRTAPAAVRWADLSGVAANPLRWLLLVSAPLSFLVLTEIGYVWSRTRGSAPARSTRRTAARLAALVVAVLVAAAGPAQLAVSPGSSAAPALTSSDFR